jgi:(p)ppGpp synthase/HD superfamily hydrolase
VNIYQRIINHTRDWIDYNKKIVVSINEDIPCGRGYPQTREIELPVWLNSFDVMYRIYYVIHEMVHCLTGIKHDKRFMSVEDTLLNMWDLRIVRRKVYPKQLFWKDRDILNIPSNRYKTRRKLRKQARLEASFIRLRYIKYYTSYFR